MKKYLGFFTLILMSMVSVSAVTITFVNESEWPFFSKPGNVEDDDGYKLINAFSLGTLHLDSEVKTFILKVGDIEKVVGFNTEHTEVLCVGYSNRDTLQFFIKQKTGDATKDFVDSLIALDRELLRGGNGEVQEEIQSETDDE